MACVPQFPVKNGVKQGGVISPVLFCIYIDKLLLELSKSGFGCFIGEVFKTHKITYQKSRKI